MNPSDAARPYARALYEVAASQEVVEQVGHDLSLLQALWREGPDELAPFLTHPLIHTAAKEALLERVLGGAIHPCTLNLVRILVRRGKAALLADLAPAYYREQEQEGRAFHVVARTAQPLTPDQRGALQSRLVAALGRPVTLEEVVVPGLMAGVELVVSGRRLDTSLRGRLQELAAQLRG
ncbi:MAG: hypothetical protein BIP78_0652 [Candidatus Bipolaricaulis sibiricus]|uniref:ATP synthase subunit delta n=1 Tax=Bipolaricaulis sibiricus TaxID=2501609 RepID=A0A410FTY0_BIPS1|nr:MAG: hypothetical protein BIP78_0652 [Candidatus Bipolaricaulis sibiricus]